MKIGINFPGFNISARGLSIQRKRMNLIAENIANADATRMANGQPYQRKYLQVKYAQNPFTENLSSEQTTIPLKITDQAQIANPEMTIENGGGPGNSGLTTKQMTDATPGEMVYNPDNPFANAQGYVQQSNVNVIKEMVDMISATRNYESNLTALNSSKQMVKDSLDI